MTTYIHVFPALDRDWELASEIKDDWNNGLSFTYKVKGRKRLIDKNNKPTDTKIIVHYDNASKTVII